MRKSASGEHTVVAAGILERPPRAGATDGDAPVARPSLSPRLRARYVALTVSSGDALIKLLSFPGRFDTSAEEKIAESLGLEKPEDFRIAYRLIREGHARAESRVLAVAMPDDQASQVTALFSSGLPAPFSLEQSGLAALSAFAHGPLRRNGDQTVGVIEFGDSGALVAFFHRGVLALVRQFTVGAHAVLSRVQETLNVDPETAKGILGDQAFDTSQPVMEVLSPLIKQVVVSRDFVERREDCHVEKLFVSGGVVASPEVRKELRSALDVETDVWSPMEGLNVVADAIPQTLVGQEWRLASAAGACIAAFEEE